MSCAFFFITILATVQFLIFENSGALNAEIEAQGSGFSSITLLSMGNLGEGQPLCEKVSEGEKLKLYCDEGQIIGAISKVLYGQPDGTCNCPQTGSEEAYDFVRAGIAGTASVSFTNVAACMLANTSRRRKGP